MQRAVEARLGEARAALAATFGHAGFRSYQEPVIRALLDGEDALAVMPTGAGKSLCYQVPALVMDGLTVVVSPLVALMEDQVAALRVAGVAAEAIHSGREREANIEAWRRVAAGEARMLYLSPERLMTPRMIEALVRLEPAMFAVDEAHCISRWGAAFRPDYEQLSRLREAFPGARLAAFTATADPSTRDDIVARLFGGRAQVFVAGFDRPNITLAAEPRAKWRDQLAAFLGKRRGMSGIVYCLSRKNTGEIADFLCGEGIAALPYHAGMSPEARSVNQDRFMTESPVVMVATIAFGMGIDKPDIRFVVHTHMPANVEAYYQEIGRAGRDGEPAEALMLYGFDDIRMRRRFIDEEDTSGDHKRREHKRLDALTAYAEAPTCRRVMLLSYFGETAGPCGNCDICLDPPRMVEATRPARMVLDTVRATGERFGAGHVVDILRGGAGDKVTSRGHDRLATHGQGADWPVRRWQGLVRQMVAAGHLAIDIQGYGGLSITPTGREIMEGSRTFECREELARTGEAKPRARPAGTPAGTLDGADSALFARLKAHRLALARARGVPPYVIFHDRTLTEMARARPGSVADFARLPGVGEKKCEAFAASFLAVLAEDG